MKCICILNFWEPGVETYDLSFKCFPPGPMCQECYPPAAVVLFSEVLGTWEVRSFWGKWAFRACSQGLDLMLTSYPTLFQLSHYHNTGFSLPLHLPHQKPLSGRKLLPCRLFISSILSQQWKVTNTKSQLETQL